MLKNHIKIKSHFGFLAATNNPVDALRDEKTKGSDLQGVTCKAGLLVGLGRK